VTALVREAIEQKRPTLSLVVTSLTPSAVSGGLVYTREHKNGPVLLLDLGQGGRAMPMISDEDNQPTEQTND
jgi:hypothetical protein